MLFNSSSSQALQAGMDAMWLKMQVHSNNIANEETPGFKAQNVSFGEVLQRTQANGEKAGLLRATVYTDNTTDARLDGNNVNMEKEQLELWRVQAQYAYAVSKINGEYSKLRTILSQVGN